ncbi:MAG TPA: nucleotide sugar dehydrogenase, partial [Flavobacteriales bacterium]|nr:nucleotide sugar dehydrogenase [Flavobacteriales bacterium]
CIGVDPYYLVYKAKEYGYHPQIINSGRFVNDSMGAYTAKQTVKKIIASGKQITNSKVLVMGATFKENVADIRNSKVVDVINEFKSFGVEVDVIDPHADSEELMKEYGFGLVEKPANDYDAVYVAVNHKEFLDLDEDYFKSITTSGAVITDIKGIYKDKIKDLTYWSL